jgi:hypothetical protein
MEFMDKVLAVAAKLFPFPTKFIFMPRQSPFYPKFSPFPHSF